MANLNLLNRVLRHAVDEDHHDHEHGIHIREDEENSSSEGVFIAKTTAMIVLFCASMFMGLLPVKLSKWFKWTHTSDVKSNIYVSLLLSFGGGVLLCTTFQHLLPEVAETIAELQEHNQIANLRFHLAEFLMCIGFFAIFLVEEIVHLYLHSREKRNTEIEHVFNRSLSIRRSENCKTGVNTISTSDLLKSQSNGTLNEVTVKTIPDCGPKNHNHTHENSPHSHIVPQNPDDTIVTSLRGLLVVLALSVHELFEGLAVGLESSTSNVWYMFGAVSAHKLVIAFCVGVELVASKIKMSLTVLYVFCFAVVSPLGIGIGIGLSSATESAEHNNIDVVSVVLQGLATGTLLYVVFFEVLQKDKQGLKQYFTMLLGFFLMFMLSFLTGHEHSHGHSHEEDETSHNHP